MTTKIEWVRNPDGTKGETWNPVTGCTKVSPGCKNCYAERMARRLAGRYGYPEQPHHFDMMLHPDKLDLPLRWRKPRMVFSCSMSDLFHKDIPDQFVVAAFQMMALSPHHTFQVLTKRPQRMMHYVADDSFAREVEAASIIYALRHDGILLPSEHFNTDRQIRWPLPNVWLGVSVENQAAADERIPLLLQTPAAVRFVSCEPLLGAVDLTYWLDYDPEVGARPALDWVICGGESGPGARPMHPDWARGLRDQCQQAGVPFFFKQWGAWAPYPNDGQFGPVPAQAHWFGEQEGPPDMWRVGKKAAGRLLDGRTWDEMPETRGSQMLTGANETRAIGRAIGKVEP